MSKSPDFSLFTVLGQPPIPFRAFSIAKGEILESSLFGVEMIRNRTCCASVSMLKAGVERVTKLSMQGNRDSGPDGTARKEGKAITGSGNSQSRHPP
ncbi:hypothetical protein AVEN_11066-1 [Araneus ventricosus]|uniref:Uncharacterized protein n=1 Tax=Araneus ventricosus TaxID=182803 RepID=A0A4Y2ALC1_ARAVE|nr:hypothetical protein AVEN_11066-1 [Araneus ventricosus]